VGIQEWKINKKNRFPLSPACASTADRREGKRYWNGNDKTRLHRLVPIKY